MKPAATRRIPLARPYLDEREEELVARGAALGPALARADDRPVRGADRRARSARPTPPRSRVGRPGCICSLTIAGLGPGDEVITSPSDLRRLGELLHLRGRDAGLRRCGSSGRWNLDPAAVEAAITERTKALVAVDMFGYPCELDAADGALRAAWDHADRGLSGGARRGVQGRSDRVARPACVFGFYPNKQLATGEGGVVTTHSEEEWRLLRSLRNHGRSYEGGGWFNHVRLGFNYRWTDLQAAVGLAQLEKLDRMLDLRSAAAARYADLLADVDGVTLGPGRRRRPPPVVVRLRRRARTGGRPRAGDGRDAGARGGRRGVRALRPPADRTCATATASAKGSVPVGGGDREPHAGAAVLPGHRGG